MGPLKAKHVTSPLDLSSQAEPPTKGRTSTRGPQLAPLCVNVRAAQKEGARLAQRVDSTYLMRVETGSIAAKGVKDVPTSIGAPRTQRFGDGVTQLAFLLDGVATDLKAVLPPGDGCRTQAHSTRFVGQRGMFNAIGHGNGSISALTTEL